MSIRVHSDKTGINWWYCGIPKTGSQSVLKFIQDNIPADKLINTLTGGIHMPVRSIVNHPGFGADQGDSIFITVRNPWAFHWSMYNYQKYKTESKYEAYKAGPSGVKQWKEDNPDTFVADYDQSSWWEVNQLMLDEVFLSFETYLNKLEDIVLREVFVNSIEELNRIPFTDSRQSRVDDNIHLIDSRVKPCTMFYYLDNNLVAGGIARQCNMAVFKIETPHLIEKFFDNHFDVRVELPHINRFGYIDYKSVYTEKMIKQVENIESRVIKLFGYKFGE